MPGEAAEIQTQHGKLLFIDAPVEERYRRIYARSRGADDSKTLEEFIAHDRIEFEGLGGPNWPNLRAIKDMSDHVLNNDGTESDFITQLDWLLI